MQDPPARPTSQIQLQPPTTGICGSDLRPRQQQRPVWLEWKTEITTLG
jgi:threonine dehydrogenase-like Zn-dependent dehydrogenase